MPTYEYQCGHCGRFQTVQPITEPALTECPTCGQPVQRLISRNIGIIFKGSGFYCTDHRGKTSLTGGGDESKKPAAGDGKESKATEAAGSSCSACPGAAKKQAADKPAANK
jgi:putative FmdB family regulatory protein